MKLNIGKNIIVDWVVNGKISKSVNYTVPANFNSWDYDDIFSKVEPNSSSQLFIYPQNEIITTKQVTQLFKDGITHCFFTQITDAQLRRILDSC